MLRYLIVQIEASSNSALISARQFPNFQCHKVSHAMSSINIPTKLRGANILHNSSSENPIFYDYHKVYFKYCSSDFWLGNGAPTVSSPEFAFQGLHIFRESLKDIFNLTVLMQNVSYSSPVDASDIVFVASASQTYHRYLGLLHPLLPLVDGNATGDGLITLITLITLVTLITFKAVYLSLLHVEAPVTNDCNTDIYQS